MIYQFLRMVESEAMKTIFLKLVNMSIAASWLVLAVLILRLGLKKAPKWVNVLLWGIVALRLVCPFTLESALSLIPSAETISPEIMLDRTPEISTGIEPLDQVVNPVISTSFAPDPGDSANPLQILIPVAAGLWLLGMGAMALYTALSYCSLRRKLRTAVRLRENIFQCETVHSPFVLGILKPKIYLPYSLEGQDLSHVVAHEQAHIRRKDHWWKPLGFLLLTVHWFNPLMWLAYCLLCRDIELACDEKVIAELGNEQRADYSQALVACSVNRRMIAACPLAFGEVGVKERVRSILHYRKPAFWVMVTAVAVCILVAVCFLTDPVPVSKTLTSGDYLIGQVLYAVTVGDEISTAPPVKYRLTADHSLYLQQNEGDEWTYLGDLTPYTLSKDEIYGYMPVDVMRKKVNLRQITDSYILKVANDNFYLMFQTENGKTYLAYGWEDVGERGDPGSDDTRLRRLYLLEETAISPQIDSIAISHTSVYGVKTEITVTDAAAISQILSMQEAVQVEQYSRPLSPERMVLTFFEGQETMQEWTVSYYRQDDEIVTCGDVFGLGNRRVTTSFDYDWLLSLVEQAEDKTVSVDNTGKTNSLNEIANEYISSELGLRNASVSIGKQLSAYRLEEYGLEVIDYEMYPVLADGAVAAFATWGVTEEGDPYAGCGAEFAEAFWKEITQKPEQPFAIVYARNGAYLVREQDAPVLLHQMPLSDYAPIEKLEPYRDSMMYDSLNTQTEPVLSGTVYVPYQCIYMNPLSSYAAMGGDSGCKYIITEDSFVTVRRDNGNVINAVSYPGVETLDTNAPQSSLPVSDWDWKPFPYTDAQWEAMYFPGGFGAIQNISGKFQSIGYIPLSADRMLLNMDGDLWLVDLSNDPTVGTYIWSIYALVPENTMGFAQWEYAPMLSSRLPVFRFRFDMEYTEIQASCTEGYLVPWDTPGSSSDTVMTYKEGCDLYWSPAGENGTAVTSARIFFSVLNGDELVYQGNIYLDGSSGSDGRRIYNASLVGAGLYLAPNTESEGARITERGTVRQMLRYDLTQGKLEIPIEELGSYAFYTNSETITVKVKGSRDFAGSLTLVDVSQDQAEIQYADVSARDKTCVFSGLTSARLYGLRWTGLEGCTVIIK